MEKYKPILIQIENIKLKVFLPIMTKEEYQCKIIDLEKTISTILDTEVKISIDN